MTDATSVTPFKYRAFISYSHADKAWGDWLHKALESFRVPAKLAGMPTASAGPVPRRLYPIFRDREELPTSSDLGGQITAALAASQFLIVIASPRSAKSRWVNEEILAFKRLGRSSYVLPIIVDGEPNAAGKTGFDPDTDCFCPALKFAIDADGRLSDTPVEPICADARPQGDGKDNALLKLVAGLLNVGFDALKQRDAEARRKRLILRTALAGVALAALLGGGSWLAISQRNAAEDRSAALARLSSEALARGEPASAARFALAGGASANRGLLTPDTARADAALASAALALRWRGPAMPHGGHVNAAFSRDGARLLTWSDDGAARLWDAASGAQIGDGMAHDAPLRAAAFAGGGAWIATASEDGRIRIWNAATLQLAHETLLPDAELSAMKVSQDGGLVVVRTVATDASPARIALHLFDAGLAALGEPLSMAAAPVLLEIAPDGARVLAGHYDETRNRFGLILIDPAATEQAAVLDMSAEPKHALFSPDGSRIVATDETGRLSIWNAADGAPIALGLKGGERPERWLGDVVVALEVSPDGASVMAASSDGYAYFYALADGAPVRAPYYLGQYPSGARFVGPDAVLATLGDKYALLRPLGDPSAPGIRFGAAGEVAAAEPLRGGRRILTHAAEEFAAEAGSLSLWDAATGDRLGPAIPTGPGAFTAAAPDGGAVVAVERGQAAGSEAARLWRVEVDARVPQLGRWSPLPYVDGVAMTADGAHLLAFGGGVWLGHSATGRGQVLIAPETAASAQFSPDGRSVLAIAGDALTVFDAASGTPRGAPALHDGEIVHAAFAPDGRRIVTAAADGMVRVIDAATGQFSGPAIEAGKDIDYAWFAGSDHARILTVGHAAQLWDPATAAPAGPEIGNLGHRIDADISPDGTLLLLTRPNTDARIWNVETGREANWPARHPDKVYLGAFSPDGRLVVTVANDSAARLWSLATGAQIGAPMFHRDPIKSVAFSADSGRLLTASADGAAQIWDVASATPIGPAIRSGGDLTGAAMSAGGALLVTGAREGDIALWDAASLNLSADDAAAKACAVLAGAGQSRLTAEELRAAPFLDPSTQADPCAG